MFFLLVFLVYSRRSIPPAHDDDDSVGGDAITRVIRNTTVFTTTADKPGSCAEHFPDV